MANPPDASLPRAIIGAFYEVYNRLGFGFLEAHYATALELELRSLNLNVAREYAVQVTYKGVEIGFHRLDMVVEGVVVVEIKSSPTLPPFARRQVYNYLRSTGLDMGLLLHFGPAPRFQKLFLLSQGQQASRPEGA